MNSKVSLDQLGKQIFPAALICSASFEDRCRSVLTNIHDQCCKIFLFKNKQKSELAEANFTSMCSLAGEKLTITELDIDSPANTADALGRSIDSILLDSDATKPILVDITTFTHEQVLILLAMFSERRVGRRVIFCYTGADQYSTNTSPDDAWLSKGVSQIRSVLGFPGTFLPSRHLHLILLLGFEFERAKNVIERFEPASITIGIGGRKASVAECHHETNKRFFEKLNKFIGIGASIYTNVSSFEFSCVDPISTKNTILESVKNNTSYNTVVCPMNTKLSTLGVGLAALEDHRIQICYPRAISYNEHGYSTPSSMVTLFEMSF